MSAARLRAGLGAGEDGHAVDRGGGAGGGPGGQGGFRQITTWVKAHYKSAAVRGQTVYLLLQPKS